MSLYYENLEAGGHLPLIQPTVEQSPTVSVRNSNDVKELTQSADPIHSHEAIFSQLQLKLSSDVAVPCSSIMTIQVESMLSTSTMEAEISSLVQEPHTTP